MFAGTKRLTKYRYGIARDTVPLEHGQGNCDQTQALQCAVANRPYTAECEGAVFGFILSSNRAIDSIVDATHFA